RAGRAPVRRLQPRLPGPRRLARGGRVLVLVVGPLPRALSRRPPLGHLRGPALDGPPARDARPGPRGPREALQRGALEPRAATSRGSARAPPRRRRAAGVPALQRVRPAAADALLLGRRRRARARGRAALQSGPRLRGRAAGRGLERSPPLAVRPRLPER